MRVNEKGYRGLYASNNSPLVYLIPGKLNGYKGHAEIEQELSQVVWNSHSKDSFDRNWNDFLLKYGLVNNKSLRRLSYMGSNLSGSPFLGRDEKHTKEQEHAFIFLTSSLHGTARLSNLLNNTIIASEVGSKQRENQVLQIFIRSYRVQ
ncbi:hypothetical protein Ahy_B06g080034 [Arachis hypogaea]|uniref:Uncharacterized protein n=1 Tax=Arachis hypogaea TaxID=3818 RepID=A0A444YGZ7_ARAHY|nr:hypothetical protein Ahy_B06g080034 [Arachis hypogaea]